MSDPKTSKPADAAYIRNLEERLARAEAEAQRYRASFELAATGEALVGLDGRFLEVNARLCEITGYSREQLCALRFQDITFEDERGRDQGALVALLDGTRQVYRIEKRYRRRDGSLVWVALATSLIRGADGVPLHFISLIEDISERKRIEGELRERDALLAGLSRHMPAAIVRTWIGPSPQQGGISFASDAVRELYEMEPADAMRDPAGMGSRILPDDLTRVVGAYHESFKTLDPLHLEYRVQLPTRGLRWLRLDAGPDRQADGTVVWYGTIFDITERKQLADQLAERDLMLQQIGEFAPSMIWATCRKANGGRSMPFASGAIRTLYELEPQEVQDSTVALLARIHPEDVGRMEEARDHAYATGQPLRIEYRVLLPRAGLRWLSVHGSAPCQTPAGQMMWGITTDITERKLAESQLAERNELLAQFGEHAPSVLCAVHKKTDGERQLLYISSAVRSVYELEPDDVMRDFSLLRARMHPDDREWTDRLRHQAGLRDEPVHIEYRVVLPRKGLRWLSLHSGRPQRFPDGSFTAYMIISDVTERKAAEQRLFEREALLSSISKNVPGLIHKISHDENGDARFDYISDRAMEMFELPLEALQKDYKAFFPLVHPDDLPLSHRLARAPKPGAPIGPVEYEYRVQHPSKGLRWYGGQAVPETDTNGQLAWYGYTADITDRKQYQEARVAAQAAEAANRAKSEFLSRMSHELRTPLNAVIGFAQILRLDPTDPLSGNQAGKVELIERAGGHLLAVIGDVLDLSRIEAGSLPMSLEVLHAYDCAQDALQLVGDAAAKGRVQLRPAVVSPDLHILGDRVRLRQVLVNLLSNAIKYNRVGGEVEMRGRREGEWIVLEVADTGRGLSEAQRTRLFEPFNRLGAEQTSIEGTGIGLVIVKRLIELMSGRIDVRSTPGEGSVFSVYLPTAEPLPPPAAVDDPRPAVAEAPAGACFRVLYAEDNEVNVTLVRQIFAMRPTCQLEVARSGAATLERVAQARPDLLLLDMHLGDMSGFDVADALDRDPALAAIPRIALSADAMPDKIHAAKERGFKGYLTKPVNVSLLLSTLDEQMAQRARGTPG